MVLYHWELSELEITPEGVLRGQGADPEIIKARRPKLFDLAEQTLQEGRHYLKPSVLLKEVSVEKVCHEKIILGNGIEIAGNLISQHLASSQRVMAVICTIGIDFDNYSSKISSISLLKGLALDGVGAAAVEALANAVCKKTDFRTNQEGLSTTIPLSPGMIGWPVDQGQPVIFEILEPNQFGIELSPHFLMTPRKSISMLIGIGSNFGVAGITCDYCAMRETCRYQDQYISSRN